MARPIIVFFAFISCISPLYGMGCNDQFEAVSVTDFSLDDLDQIVKLYEWDDNFEPDQVRTDIMRVYEDSPVFKVFKIEKEVVAYFGLVLDHELEHAQVTELAFSRELKRRAVNAVSRKIKAELFAILARFKYTEIIAATYRFDTFACGDLKKAGFVIHDMEIEDNDDAVVYTFLAKNH